MVEEYNIRGSRTMELKDVQKIETEKRSKVVSVRTFPSYCKWMNENKVSPSKVFNKAIKELMEVSKNE